MRQINTDLHKQQFGLEPVVVVAIKFADWAYFGDRDHERFKGRVTEVQNLDNIINITQNATSASVTVQLIDPDGELKTAYNQTDLHLRPLKIYQYFIGSDFDTDKILLFEGYVASPVIYDEAQMSLTFTGLSRLKNIEVGFSPDNAVWQHIIPNELEAKPWPMPFGSPSNYPLTQITKEPTGALVHGFGIPDFTSTAAGAAASDYAHGLWMRMAALSNSYFIIGNMHAATVASLEDELKSRQTHYANVMASYQEGMNNVAYEERAEGNWLAGGMDYSAYTARIQRLAVEYASKYVTVINSAASLLGSPSGATSRQQAARNLQEAQQNYSEASKLIQTRLAAARARYQADQRRISAAQGEIARAQAERDRILAVIEQERLAYEQQEQYSPEGEHILIFNGKKFPPKELLWLKIGDCLVHGRFTHSKVQLSGDSTFKVTRVVHPKECDFNGSFCTELVSSEAQVYPHVNYGSYMSVQDGVNQGWVDGLAQGTLPADITTPTDHEWTYRDDSLDSSFYLNTNPEFNFDDWSRHFVGQMRGGRAGFAWVSPGSSVRIAYSNPVEFIISIVPCEVKAIKAYQTYANARRLTDVPTDWYTISERDYGDGLTATVLTLLRPLDTLANAGFESQVYATVESSIGPNVVDVIEHLVGKYLPDKVCDTTTFDRVRAEVEDWPVNFVLTSRPTILDLLSDICYQACIGIWFYDSTVYLRYLPNLPDDVLTISEDDMDFESLELQYTETEDLITKIIAVYRPNYTLEEPYRLAARYNTAKYGTNEQTTDYFIYNDREAVVHSVTFWLIRQANTWKRVQFSTALSTLVFDTMDAVQIQLPGKFAANGPVTGIIEQVQYDTETFTLNYVVWLPVRAGEMEQYKFAYLNVGNIDDQFPEPEAWLVGNGLGSPVIRDLEQGETPHGTVINYNWPDTNTLPVNRQPRKARELPPEPTAFAIPATVSSGTPIFKYVDGGIGDDGQYAEVAADGAEVYTAEDLTEEAEEVEDTVDIPDLIGEPDDLTISLHRTLIFDENTQGATPLAAFFSEVNGTNLVVRHRFMVRNDEENQLAPFELAYDAEQQAFAAKLAFLADEENPIEPDPGFEATPTYLNAPPYQTPEEESGDEELPA